MTEEEQGEEAEEEKEEEEKGEKEGKRSHLHSTCHTTWFSQHIPKLLDSADAGHFPFSSAFR